MFTLNAIISVTCRAIFIALLLLCEKGSSLQAQQSIALLTGGGAAPGEGSVAEGEKLIGTTGFTLVRNLISFEAEIDGHAGRYILDTGAPSLVLNNRGQSDNGIQRQAHGSGGEVAITDQRVGQFKMGGREVNNYWAIALDLRSFENRTAQRVDGFVGYDLLNAGELRIDYQQKNFGILKSRRHPSHGGLSPSLSIGFELDGHLPLIALRVGGKLHYFIIDTGAGANLVDPSVVTPASIIPTGRLMNIQGLDGKPADHPVVRLRDQDLLTDTDLVSTDLSHLSSAHSFLIAGILGSSFLRDYTVGIDYRRYKIHFWE